MILIVVIFQEIFGGKKNQELNMAVQESGSCYFLTLVKVLSFSLTFSIFIIHHKFSS